MELFEKLGDDVSRSGEDWKLRRLACCDWDSGLAR